jgi:23S rRNA pseudouridine1911/1915/1917 synthase
MPETPAGFPSAPERRRPEAEEIDIEVIYEDQSVLVVNKPPGMVVHPTYRNWSGTLLSALLWRVRGRHGVVPSIITRLDKQTSGLVLVALSPAIHARVQHDAAAGRVKKEYLAVVEGTPTPPAASIVLPLARCPEDRRRVVVTDSGQPCETRYEVIATSGGRSVVRCELITGRTHQIRVHLAARGWPILGDEVFGTSHPLVVRQALHAWHATLPHPVTLELLEFEAPVPADLHALLATTS